ncbi:MAG TPA: (d)CMP kinase [Candidatus Deferrimicrobiaceae bacterium]
MSARSRPIVTIDGPAGSGKTTVSKRLAERAGLLRLDTGATYRACALAARRAGISWENGPKLGELCAGLDLAFRREGGELRVILSGEDVSEAIRTPDMGMGASDVSRHPQVREALVALQRRMGDEGGVVLEGRDTGTVVFPDAEVKFFLDAVAAVRARRRFLEWKNEAPPFEEVLRDVLRRDIQDSTRDHSPLRMAEGAVYIDSTTMTIDEVVDAMMRSIPT